MHAKATAGVIFCVGMTCNVARDLKLSGLSDDWHALAQNHNEWCRAVKQQVREVNIQVEQDEKQCIDFRKKWWEKRLESDEAAIQCYLPGYVLVVVNMQVW